MYGTASKLGKMLMHIKWIVLAKENNFLLSRPCGTVAAVLCLPNRENALAMLQMQQVFPPTNNYGYGN